MESWLDCHSSGPCSHVNPAVLLPASCLGDNLQIQCCGSRSGCCSVLACRKFEPNVLPLFPPQSPARMAEGGVEPTRKVKEHPSPCPGTLPLQKLPLKKGGKKRTPCFNSFKNIKFCLRLCIPKRPHAKAALSFWSGYKNSFEMVPDVAGWEAKPSW